MFYLIVQTVLLLSVAFVLGAIIGCLLRRLVGNAVDDRQGEPATVAAAAPVAARVPHRPQARLVPQPLEPIEAPLVPGAVPVPGDVGRTAETVEGAGFGGEGGVGSGGVAPEVVAPKGGATGEAVPDDGTTGLKGVAPGEVVVDLSDDASADVEDAAADDVTGPDAADRPAVAEARPADRTTDDPSGTNDLSGAAGLIGATGVPVVTARASDVSTVEPDAAASDAPVSDAPAPDAGAPDDPQTDAADARPFGLAGAAGAGAAGVEGGRDNLKLIRGVGPRNEGRLNEIGVFRFEQIAGWTRRQQREIGEELAFPGRIERERWVAQAKQLAAGETTEYSRRPDAGRVTESEANVGERGTKPPVLEAARDGKPDNLTLIDGVGNAIERKLFRLGIYHFDQVAAWSDEETVWVGDRIGFPGRAERENWREEARILGEGGTTAHAERVERGQIKTSRRSTDEEKG